MNFFHRATWHTCGERFHRLPVRHQAITWTNTDLFMTECLCMPRHDDVIKWKHFPSHWLFVRGIQRSPVSSPHKGQWRGDLAFSLICAWINFCANNGGALDLRRHCAHYDVKVINWIAFNLYVRQSNIYRPYSHYSSILWNYSTCLQEAPAISMYNTVYEECSLAGDHVGIQIKLFRIRYQDISIFHQA